MDELEKEIALLERFIENDLSLEEKEAVEKRLLEEEDLKILLGQVKTLINGIKLSGRNVLKDKLEAIEEQLPAVEIEASTSIGNEEKMKDAKIVFYKQTKFWMSIAATIILVVAVKFLFIDQQSMSPNELYAQHFDAYMNLENAITRGESSTEQLSIEEEAMKAYDQENYKMAISMFSKITANEMDSGNFLYLGNSFLSIGETDKAIESLKKGLLIPGNYENQLNWYLGLAYLQSNDVENAKLIFEKISSSNYSRKNDAAAIVKELIN